MIKVGANINITDTNSLTAAIKVAIYGSVKWLDKLKMAGADGVTDEVGQTALFHVSKKVYHRVVEILINPGGDVNVTDICHKRPAGSILSPV